MNARTRLAGWSLLLLSEMASAAAAFQFDDSLALSENNGVVWQAEPRFNEVLVLPERGSAAVDIPAIDNASGTISFWVKPHWASPPTKSHTILSATWSGDRRSYLAISEGWWEPSGARRLYFIFSNEDIRHCSSERALPTEEWTLVTATWSQQGSVCKLFLDDELVAETRGDKTGALARIDKLHLGTDAAASDRRDRFADASVAALSIKSKPSSHRDVMARYAAEEDPDALHRKKWAWLEVKRPTPGSKSTASHRRALFDEDISWSASRDAIDRRLERISKAGFDIYIPCVWHGSGAWYPTRAATVDSRLSKALSTQWDPLAYLVQRAHALGIEVHPWFTVVRRESNDHPEWAEEGTPSGAFDIHQPSFRRYIVDAMLDVVRRYPVDGINLDYIRAMGQCLSSRCKQLYRSATGMDLEHDLRLSSTDGAAWLRIERWQDGAVDDIVRSFSLEARKLRPDIVISVDGHALPRNEKRPLEGRNEIAWANNGWIDGVFHMEYRPVFDAARIDALRGELNDPEKLWLLVANFDLIDGQPVPRSGRWMRGVADLAESRASNAVFGVYLYGQLRDEHASALNRDRGTAPGKER